MPLIADLFWYAAIFVVAWVIYAALHAGAAQLRVVQGVGNSTVALGVIGALFAGVLGWLFLAPRFSSPSAYELAVITAPICFLGYCGIWVLLGPVTVDRSITLTILRALYAINGQNLPNQRLRAAVPFDRIYEKRLRELTLSGVIEPGADDFRITPKGARALKLYFWLGRVLNVEMQ